MEVGPNCARRFAVVVAVAASLLLVGASVPASALALVDDSQEHIAVTETGRLTGPARDWLRNFDASAQTRWQAGSSTADADVLAFKKLLVGRFLPPYVNALPAQPGQVAKKEVCSGDIHAGCWSYQRDDTGLTTGSSSNSINWTPQTTPVASGGSLYGYHFPDLAGMQDFFHATWSGGAVSVQFTEDKSSGCTPSWSWTDAGLSARRAIATEQEVCFGPNVPPSGAPATRSTVWAPAQASLATGPDDPTVTNSTATAPYASLDQWTTQLGQALMAPANKSIRDWIATDIQLQTPSTPIQHGTTVVHGMNEVSRPLEIDPSSSPTDPLTTPLTPNNPVAFVRMPQTKQIYSVTLGDFATATTCTGTSQARLIIYEHQSGNFDGTKSQLAYSAPVAITGTLSKLTFPLVQSSVRLLKGRGYEFYLQNYSGCGQYLEASWAHNTSIVDPGTASCTGGPYAGGPGGGAGFVDQRMWHVQGMDDATSGCVSLGPGSRTFNPAMPTGWLYSYHYGCCNDDTLKSTTTWEQHSSACGTAPVHPDVTYWRESAMVPYDDYVCLWSHFAPLGSAVDDGWYYGLPWRSERQGAPRDIYVRLDTVDFSQLLQARAPGLAFAGDEKFLVQDAAALSDLSVPDPDGAWSADGATALKDNFSDPNSALTLARAGAPDGYTENGVPVGNLTLGTLADTYPFAGGWHASSNDFLDAPGSDSGQYKDQSDLARAEGLTYKVYAHAVAGSDGAVWLQYWSFYYYNNWTNGVVDDLHEGDWEMVQVRLNSSLQPDRVTYARHDYAVHCDWSLQTVDKTSDGAHPIVDVASGSHASYQVPGTTPIRIDGTPSPANDDHLGDGSYYPPGAMPLEVLSDPAPSWVSWPGHWGSSNSALFGSPTGPGQHPQWSDPSGWDSGAYGCE